MSPSIRYAKKPSKARQRRRLQAHERLERDQRQAQRAIEALEQALHDLGLPENLVPFTSLVVAKRIRGICCASPIAPMGRSSTARWPMSVSVPPLK